MSDTLQLNPQYQRQFLPDKFKVTDWNKIKPYYRDLLDRDIDSVEDLEQWLRDRSELEMVLGEEYRWRYVKTTIDTKDEEAKDQLEFFIETIHPHMRKHDFDMNEKLLNSDYVKKLDEEKYRIYLRGIRKSVELFREENIDLYRQLTIKENEYGEVSGNWSIEMDGKELTFQQASLILKSQDRAKREEVYRKISERRLQDKEKLDNLYDELIALRHKIAQNCGFDNYRDYAFAAMGRFDYTPEDCLEFHNAIAKEISPLMEELKQERKEKLGLDKLRPWDLAVDPDGKEPVKPFSTVEELVDKSIEVFDKIDPYFGKGLRVMKERNNLDLDSRLGKAPGGYNMSMPEMGVPFIFMNAAYTDRDVRTMMHEGGHAMHSFLSFPLEINGFKNYPSEVAEYASMSMELMSMDYWETFYADDEELVEAKKKQINEEVFRVFPSVAMVDGFQHWVYTNPEHTHEERHAKWLELQKLHHPDAVVDWNEFEEDRASNWQRILHIFEVPFYYVEYGIAQLGAMANWRNYLNNRKETIENYKAALSLGYTKSIPEIYETAHIKFDFSREYVKELVEFMQAELKKLD